MNVINSAVRAVPLPAFIMAAGFGGVVLGIALFPIPPYSNVGPAAGVSILLLFVSAFVGCEAKERVQK